MRRVYKYVLPIVDDMPLMLPLGAKILSVQNQNGNPCLWALVDPDEKTHVVRHFRMAGTGHDIDAYTDMVYIGTFQLHDGHLAFHLFEANTK